MLLPYVASAEGVECAEGIKYEGVNLLGVLCVTQLILRRVVVLLVSFAVIFFIYVITKYITAGEDEDKRNKMKNLMVYGIIGLFVIVSMWGIVYLLVNSFNLDLGKKVEVPYFPKGKGSDS